MKIYNEVVIDMNTGETVYEDSFEYNGPVDLCCIVGQVTPSINLEDWQPDFSNLSGLDFENTYNPVDIPSANYDYYGNTLEYDGLQTGDFSIDFDNANWGGGGDFSFFNPNDLNINGGGNGGGGNGNGGGGNRGGGNGGMDVTSVSGVSNIATSVQDLGISTGAVGTRQELGRMLETYTNRRSLIQAPQRQKSVYTIDRFDGGLNLNKSPRDLSYWEACQMDCVAPSKIGRLVRLGDFGSQNAKTGLIADDVASIENYGLHYFKFSNEKDLGASGTPTNYIAAQDGGHINIFDLSDNTVKANAIDSLNASAKPVYHSASNRVFVSDASFASSKSYTFGIEDRRKFFPYTSGSTVSYCVTGSSVFIEDAELYQNPPTKGTAAGRINVVGTQANDTDGDGTAINGVSDAEGQHHGVYMNINFESMSEETSGTGWGGTEPSGAKFYYIYASILYDGGSETKLTVVSDETAAAGASDETGHTIRAMTTTAGVYQKMVIKQVYIDSTDFIATHPRAHGVRFYYTEADGDDGNPIGNDKYLFAELDFRYGFKLVSEFGNWNLFENDSSAPAAIQVKNAASGDSSVDEADGTLSISSPPTAFTYYALNLFHQEEIKEDLLWKASAVGNGIAFIGNIKYDGRIYTDTMLYSGAGETDSGSAYPMWGTFPVDSNRIDIPGAAGEITALKWINNRVLQFRQNALYVVNVENVLAPIVEGVYQGMGVHGQYAVTETSFGCAWVNDTGCYAYNAEQGKARSLTIGRLDTEDWQSGSPHANTKIGYDDRAKMLIVTNHTNAGSNGYHFAYSFVTDSWCSWNGNKSQAALVKTNFAIDHDGYLTGGIDDGTAFDIYKWSASATTTATIDYVTKDIDFGKPNLDKRFYTLYISYIGGTSNSISIYFRVNGREGKNLTDNWLQLGTVDDYTDPYGDSTGTVWATSGSPTTGDPYVPTSGDGLDSTDTGEQKLAKINLRSLSGSVPADYLKFARSIQLRFTGTAATTFEINDISLVFKEKRLK